MKRDLSQLSRNVYDILVIGGGIYGAWIVCDAVLRGLSAALVDKGDFGSGTSSNTLKIVHGGLRYLQHADFRRMRQSIRERTIMMKVAPHLVHPLPCLMPTYGHFMKGKEIMTLALMMNDLISYDRNRLNDPEKHLSEGRVISRDECVELFPGVNKDGLTGGAVWHDCQMYNSERIIMSILRSAERSGADLANYVEVTEFLKNGDRITGVKALDLLSQEEIEVRAKIVVNASGPWVDYVLKLANGNRRSPVGLLSKAMNIVVKRQLVPKYAVGVTNPFVFKDKDAVLDKGSRLFFIAPWRGFSLVGTSDSPYYGSPNDFRITEKDIEDFIAEVNRAYLPGSLRREDVSFVHSGLIPVDGVGNGDVRVGKKYRIRDHQEEDGIGGLVSVVGVKYTTARDVAEKVIDLTLKKLEKKPRECLTGTTPVYGGNIERFDDFLSQEIENRTCGLNADVIKQLVYNYGSEYSQVLKYIDENPSWSETLGESSHVIKAEVVHAVREEMAEKLSDVVFRRTELGSAGNPGETALSNCAAVMAKELDWNEERVRRELDEVRAIFPA